MDTWKAPRIWGATGALHSKDAVEQWCLDEGLDGLRGGHLRSSGAPRPGLRPQKWWEKRGGHNLFIDVYWCLLMFIDVYWCLLMFIDVYSVICSDLRIMLICPGTQDIDVHDFVFEYWELWISFRGAVKMFFLQGVHRSSRLARAIDPGPPSLREATPIASRACLWLGWWPGLTSQMGGRQWKKVEFVDQRTWLSWSPKGFLYFSMVF